MRAARPATCAKPARLRAPSARGTERRRRHAERFPAGVTRRTPIRRAGHASRGRLADRLAADRSTVRVPATIQSVTRAETVWTRILGVLLLLLGLTLLGSPEITYMRRERIPNSRFTVKTEKIIVVSRPAALLIIGAGLMALIFAREGSASS